MSSPTAAWLNRWHVSPTVQNEYDVIDGLRGIAILLVVGCHLVYVNPSSSTLTQLIGGVFAAGSCGVTLFFALSGFLISWPFWKRKAAGDAISVPPGYAKRRFWKIYPPLALSLVLLTPVYILRSHDSSYVQVASQWLVGLPVFKTVSGALNPVMWSLVVEVQFYIVLPLIFLSLKRVGIRTTLWIVFLAFLVLPAMFRSINAAHGVYFSIHPEINVHFPALLDAFAFGILMAGLDNLQFLRRHWAKLGDLGILILLAGLLTSSLLGVYSNRSDFFRSEVLHWMTNIASLLLLFYVANPVHPRSLALCNPLLRWCGLVSYEWYLFHQPIAIWMRSLFGPTNGSALKYVVLMGCSLSTGLVLAAIVYKYFSLPILKYGRSRSPHLKRQPRVEAIRALEKV